MTVFSDFKGLNRGHTCVQKRYVFVNLIREQKERMKVKALYFLTPLIDSKNVFGELSDRWVNRPEEPFIDEYLHIINLELSDLKVQTKSINLSNF